MDRNYIVELIKDNRLQEALKAIEKASKGSHLHNQIIILSSSYAEYAQMNRNATQDAQSLEIKRAKITNSMLSFLDELSPEELEKVEMPKRAVQQETIAHTPSIESTIGGNNKMYLYIAAACLVLACAYWGYSKGEEKAVAANLAAASTAQPNITQPSSTQPSSTQPAAIQSSNTKPNSTQPTTTTQQNNTKPSTPAEINGRNVGIVEYDAGQGKVGVYEDDGTTWHEEGNGRNFKFKEVGRDEFSVYLRDDSRGVNIQLDLHTKQVKYSDDKGASYVLYKITHAAE